jgi:hypothetical protein
MEHEYGAGRDTGSKTFVCGELRFNSAMCLTLDELLERCLPDMLNCITGLSSSSDFTFANFANDQLVSDPPSQDNVATSDSSVIFNCYPRSRTLFSDEKLASLVRHGLSDVDIMASVI